MERSGLVDPLIGHLVDGRYLVGARIARGGMAAVYEAIDTRLDRTVALKVMAESLGNADDFGQRFVREARSAARLTHPNIVAVYDQGDDHGVVFLVMEYVAGRRTLRDLIREEAPLAPRRAAQLIEEVARGIAAAHESGVVHRDIKPENVLIDPRGQLKVADFGLARLIESTSAVTSTGGLLMGTVSYLPPELMTDGIVDARSDVYALGVMFFELLTGMKPYRGDTPIQIAYQHVNNDVPPPSSLADGIPAYLDAFVERATSRQRELRPADAYVLLQQLRRVRHALDSGVLVDDELADDLTPTIAISRARDGGSSRSTIPISRDGGRRDDVFDISVYPDFRVEQTESAPTIAQPVVQTISRSSPPPAMPSTSVSGPREPDTTAYSSAYLRRRRRGWIALLVVLVMAAAAAVGGWYYGVGRFRSTPNVVHLEQSAAQARIENAGLSFVVGSTAYSGKVASGEVISSDPGPGDKVVKNGTVTVVISKGPKSYLVPHLATLTVKQAEAAVKGRHLDVKITRRWARRFAKGQLIGFTPQAGTPLHRGDPVDLIVSRGPKPIPIADDTGKVASDSAAAFRDAGFKVVTRHKYDDGVTKGLVIAQHPSKGVGYPGDTIRLLVSKGPHLVPVPDVHRYGVVAAETALTNDGFSYRVKQYELYLGLGYVAAESPKANEMIPYGSTVTIYIV